MTTYLPVIAGALLALALTLYALLDGFDLGVGALLLVERDQAVRDQMVESIAPMWDGNETWLVLAAVTLLGAFPTAYGILLPAFYAPIVLMLLALGLRGVSFEFRHQSRHRRGVWDAVFGTGSLVAAMAQGLVVGGLLQGVRVEGTSFAGSVGDVFTPFCGTAGVAVVAWYLTLGAAWVEFKGRDQMRQFAMRRTAPVAVTAVCLSAAVALWAGAVQPVVMARSHDRAFPLTLCAVGAVAFIVSSVRLGLGRNINDSLRLLVTDGAVVSAIAAFLIIVAPDVVPFRLSIWRAASSVTSQLLLVVGAVIVIPVILAYTGFAYWVFRGKALV